MKKTILAAAILVSFSFLILSCTKTGYRNGDIQIDPMADVHPTVIMEGVIRVGPFTRIGPGVVMTGNIEVGHHSLIQCNTTLRGRIRVGNYVHIYDNVNIEGGRPAKTGTSTNEVPDQSIIGDYCWINHGSVMHGTQMEEGAAMGLGCACDYNTRIGAGAILANGSATRLDQIIPPNSFAEGVPATVKHTDIDDDFRTRYFGLNPRGWVEYEAPRREEEIQNLKQ